MAVMAGGHPAALSVCESLLSNCGKVTRVGPPGAGSLCKLCNQLIVGSAASAVAEAVLLAKRGGADVPAVLQALQGGFADSPVLREHGGRMARGDYEPGGPAKYMLKDLRTVLGEAEGLG